MVKFRIGCQTYTWEMLGREWKGSVDNILDIISGAGYEGVEITNNVIDKYYDKPKDFTKALENRGLKLAAFGFVPLYGFTDSTFFKEEINNAEKALDFLSEFPESKLILAGGSTPNSENYDAKFRTMCNIFNEVGERALKKGIKVDFHPHSHSRSIIETGEEYDRVMELTNPSLLGWNPDSGHIVRGGLGLLNTLKKYQNRIRHIHLKDVDKRGKWKMMGKGICDFAGVLKLLGDIGYKGWVIAEEESDEAWKDQKKAVSKNRDYLRSLGQ